MSYNGSLAGKPLPDPTLPSKLQLQRLNFFSNPPRVPSVESLPLANSRASAAIISPLRKRHSAYSLPRSPRPVSPVTPSPVLVPPIRPPRNPARPSSLLARTSSHRTKASSRPSTATDSVEGLTLRDSFPPSTFTHDKPQKKSNALSIRSRASSYGVVMTGPVEEVTPWELIPVPSSISNSEPSLHSASSTTGNRSLLTSTGLVEDVTPWELHPAPELDITPHVPISQPLKPVKSRKDPIRSPTHIVSSPSLPEGPTTLLLPHSRPTPTGPIEEVTPWELHPASGEIESVIDNEPMPSARLRNSLAMAKARIAEVTPWDLVPPPQLSSHDASNNGTASHKTKTSSIPSPSSSSRIMVDLGFSQRRRSSGSKSLHSRPHFHTPAPLIPVPDPSFSKTNSKVPSIPPSKTSPTTAKFLRAAVASLSSSRTLPTATPKSLDIPSPQEKPKFSTADRTILEELRRGINAKNSQFVVKGAGNPVTCGSMVSLGKRYHTYSKEVSPYPRSYDRDVLDLDVWESVFCQEICQSLTWHVFEKPPTKVLDLGCGTGTWLLNCARIWKDCHFVGLDIVPLHPDLQRVGSSSLASRITWVQANFLEGLPFPNEEFDFVHIKRISLGVPEDKWDALFEEILRVMKPGGAFEMIEEDLFFPGKFEDLDKDFDSDKDSDHTRSRTNSAPSVPDSDKSVDTRESDANVHDYGDGSPTTPTTSTSALPRTPSRSSSPLPTRQVAFAVGSEEKRNSKDGKSSGDLQRKSSISSISSSPDSGYVTLIPPHSRSAARPLLHVKTASSPYGQIFNISTARPHLQPKYATSAVSILGTTAAPQPEPTRSSRSDSKLSTRPRRSSSLTTSATGPNTSLEASQSQQNLHSSIVESTENVIAPKKPEAWLKTEAHAPTNPRDHTLLERMYNEMLASRFINTSPLSILLNYLEYYFKDVRTHPPLLYAFPPVYIKAWAPHEDDSEYYSSDSDDGQEAIVPELHRPHSTKTLTSDDYRKNEEQSTDTNESPWLSMHGLIRQTSPYMILDGVRSYNNALSPSTKSQFSVEKAREKSLGPMRHSRLPNKTLHLDLRTLNLHLALRVKEILACSESMWEWLLEYQAKAQPTSSRAQQGHSDSEAINTPQKGMNGGSNSSIDLFKNEILEMTRDDFNTLLSNFELDMQDHIALGNTLQDRLSWSVITTDQPADRETFDKACEKWEKWEYSRRRRQSSNYYRQSNSYKSHSTVHVPSTSVVPPTPEKNKNRRDSHTQLKRPGDDSNMNGHTMAASQVSPTSPGPSIAMPRRLSRSMRVFVGWKA